MNTRLKFGAAGMGIVLAIVCGVSAKPVPRDPYMAVVRQVAGYTRMLGSAGTDTTITNDVLLGDVLNSGQTYVTGDDGQLVLRFHPDFTRIEARADTRYGLVYSRLDSAKARRIGLEEGQLILGVTKRSPPLQVDDLHSRVRSSGNCRFSFATEAKTASTVVVLDGIVEVYNRSKDTKADVRAGQKAVSDVDGLRITDATDSELGQVGLKQNVLEVDFWNPTTEEFSTLEVEYEGN